MIRKRHLRTLLAFGCIAIAALLSSRFHFRFDLSRNGSYTPSPYSREVLARLDSPVTVTWYRSALLSQYTPAVRYIEDFLDEFERAADGDFAWMTVDPVAARKTDTIAALGIPYRRMEIKDGDTTTGEDLWSGLLLEYRDEYRVVPFLLDTTTLEYDLVRIVLELQGSDGIRNGENTVQIVYGYDGGQGAAVVPEAYRYVLPWITYAGFTGEVLSLPVRALDPGKILLVIGSAFVDDATATAIDAFLSAGGNAAFFVSGNTVDIDGDWKAVPKTGDRLLYLLDSYGFTVENSLVMDISNFMITMPALDKGKNEYIPYPFWVTVPEDSPKEPHPLLSGVRRLQFYWPSRIVMDSGSGLQSLVETSPEAIIMDAPYDTDPFGAQLSLFPAAPSSSRHTLVAATIRKGRILLVADEFLPSAMIEYTDSDANMDFLVNCIEWISGKDKLLDIKNRMPDTASSRETGSEAAAGRLAVARTVNAAVIPALVCIAGAAALLCRRKKR